MIASLKITPVLLILIFVFACTPPNENNSGTALIENQLVSNVALIDDIRNDLIALKIDTIPGNLSLIAKLNARHDEIIRLHKEIDDSDNETAADLVITYIHDHFSGIQLPAEVESSLGRGTSKPMLKLYVTLCETFYIRDSRNRYDFGQTYVRFDKLGLQARPSKMIFRRGEKITGELVVTAEPDVPSMIKTLSNVKINGQEIQASAQGWKFEIMPHVKGAGLVPYEFTCEASMQGPDAEVMQASCVVYIQN